MADPDQLSGFQKRNFLLKLNGKDIQSNLQTVGNTWLGKSQNILLSTLGFNKVVRFLNAGDEWWWGMNSGDALVLLYIVSAYTLRPFEERRESRAQPRTEAETDLSVSSLNSNWSQGSKSNPK